MPSDYIVEIPEAGATTASSEAQQPGQDYIQTRDASPENALATLSPKPEEDHVQEKQAIIPAKTEKFENTPSMSTRFLFALIARVLAA